MMEWLRNRVRARRITQLDRLTQRARELDEMLAFGRFSDATRQQLQARRDEVQEAWKFVDAIENAWHAADTKSGLFEYAAGTWGPKEADELLARSGHAWRRM